MNKLPKYKIGSVLNFHSERYVITNIKYNTYGRDFIYFDKDAYGRERTLFWEKDITFFINQNKLKISFDENLVCKKIK